MSYYFPEARSQTTPKPDLTEPVFAKLRSRQRDENARTNGIFQLLDAAEKRRRRIRTQQLPDETKFLDGRTVTEETDEDRKSAA